MYGSNSDDNTTDTTVLTTIKNDKHKIYQLYSSVQSIVKNVVPEDTKKNDENENSQFLLWLYYSDYTIFNKCACALGLRIT